MAHADDALAALIGLRDEFAAFCAGLGVLSEADTRAKVIDRILVDVLGWPEAEITREDHVHAGFLDYSFSLNKRRYIVVEAKRAGESFALPLGLQHKTLKLSGALATEKPILAAINQVRGYCDDSGARYAIATNGWTWLIFRAIREDIPWREGTARVFPGLDYVIEHFTEFWNLLSRDALLAGSLDAEFGSARRTQRRLDRVLDRLFNADLPLQRNRLHAQLFPLVKSVFEDIAEQDQLDVLQSCYVYSGSLTIVAEDLNCVITDSIPSFLLAQGAEQVLQGPDDAGRFETALIHAVGEPRGQLFLLLGGIGCGKTTFLKRYQRAVGRELLEAHTFYFHVDFLGAPLDPRDMELFVWRGVLEQLRQRYPSPFLESRTNIKRAYKADIEALRQTALRHVTHDSNAFETALSPYLEKWQGNITDYVPRLLTLARRFAKSIVIFIDNVDQLSPVYQAQVFLLAQRIARAVGAITVVSLREESYYSATVQRTFTAYSNRKFHIASPRFRKMIGNRIHYALRWLESDATQTKLPFVTSGGIPMDTHSIADFLRIVEFSIFQKNRNIARFIEAICFGNMRLALEMFTTFLGSGATDVDKMLRIYRREGAYFVAFHEFVKSIMLGDRRYYKESQSPILNLFDAGPERNSSHFTSVRMLRYLLGVRGQSTPEGQGYCDLGRTILSFEDVFDNREDVVRCLTRLLTRQLVEVDTRSVETIAGAACVRVTSAGWYYVRDLMNAFAYLDLVLQDTPINDGALEDYLRQSVYDVDNLAGHDEDKLVRIQVRFERVQRFLDYLAHEEAGERSRFGVARLESGPLSEPIVDGLRTAFEHEKAWIERRVRENRERFAEEFPQTETEELATDEDEAAEETE